ncbi:MAG: trypsin-like serine protease [Nanoarchaeota archaeon]
MVKIKSINKTLAMICTASTIGCGGETDYSVDEIDPPQKQTEIFYGEEIEHGEIPAIGGLIVGSGLCSATLIHEQMVLTAGHCISKPFYTRFIYGVSDLKEVINEQKMEFVHDAAATARYPGYNDGPAYWNDVGLVILKKRIKDAAILPIMSPELYEERLSVGNNVVIAGYGRDENDNSGVLKKANVPVMRRDDLEITIGSGFPGMPDACRGDSGGGIYVSHENADYVTGIASRLISHDGEAICGRSTIYTLPGCYQPWIREVCEENLDEESCSGFAEEVDCDLPNDKLVLEPWGEGCSYSGGGNGKENNALLLLAPLLLYGLRKRKE